MALGPPLVITEEHVDQIIDILDQSIGEVLEEKLEARS
jgi:4-aminobutyrate aminotransferase-like enzyme